MEFDRSGWRSLGEFGDGAGAFVVGEHAQQDNAQLRCGERRKMADPDRGGLLLVRDHDGAAAHAVAVEAGFDIVAWTNNPVGVRELPGFVAPPGNDVAGAMRTLTGDA